MKTIISDYGECILYIVSGLAVIGIFLWMINSIMV